jgi:cytochrome P450
MPAIDIDPGALFVDPACWADMQQWHAHAAEVRERTPALRVEREGFAPFWVLTRHADVLAVSRDNKQWRNTSWSVLNPDVDQQRARESGLMVPRSLVQLDGKEHRDHRAVANDWFKPATVKNRQPRIDDLADHFVARMRELGGACDFARDIAQPYTLRVIMDIYGVPEEDEPLMLELTQGIFGAADPEFLGNAENPEERVFTSVMNFIQYFNQLTEDKRACPADDLATVIANGEVDGCPMGDAERLWYYIIIATAGHDTTAYGLSGGMEALLHDPSQFWPLADDPDLAANAADEIVRWTSPVRHFLRYAVEDTEVAGITVPAGERVLLSYPAANRDEAAFEDAARFDVRRQGADRHLGFGMGAHFCLGAQFARREIRTMLGKLSAQLSSIELAGQPEWSQSHFVSGVKHLPIRYEFK